MTEETQLTQAAQTKKVGIREFREKFADYVDRAEQPVAITRYGNTVGFFIPSRPRRSDDEKIALKQAVARLHEMLSENGISSDEVLEELRTLQAGAHSRGALEKHALKEKAESIKPLQAQRGA